MNTKTSYESNTKPDRRLLYLRSNTLLDDLVPFTEQYVAAVSDTTVSKILTIAGDLAYVLVSQVSLGMAGFTVKQ